LILFETTTPDTLKTYFVNGLLKSIDNGTSNSDFAYNNRNELTSETQTLAARPARVVSYSYDADGLRTGLVYPSARLVDLAWTARAQLLSVSADGPPPLGIYNYDKAGRITSLTHENGISEVKSYNAANELLANSHFLNGTASVASLGGSTTTYTTNSANQYLSITGFTPISHDANGNLLLQNNVSYTWDSENRLNGVSPWI